ncbi:DUF2628 domain-containing protein [Rufibacter ruber]|uniref:DUF2628 domain-containing protein n=1 Tax=Rufibacter ruber TaxID=1783499 RepID=UPI00082A3604|nr:DUF2628 domain-containing protein [Rufibacter ruber]
MQADSPAPDNDDLQDFYRAYFGVDADYYLYKLAQQQAGTRFTFNLGAFFFGLFWMLYRKLYVQALAVVAVVAGVSFLLNYLALTQQIAAQTLQLINNFIALFWSLAIGFLGNWLYLRQAKARVTKMLQKEKDEEQAALRLQRQGSITYLPHILLAALFLVYLLLNQFLGR